MYAEKENVYILIQLDYKFISKISVNLKLWPMCSLIMYGNLYVIDTLTDDGVVLLN